MSRKTHIVGNWKMNQTVDSINDFFSTLQNLENRQDKLNCEAWIAPQFIHIPLVMELAKKSGGYIKVGAQNCSHQEEGAFTGDISPLALADLGAHFTLIGHSERRAFFRENHDILNKKVHMALKHDLKIIFCVGETLEERELNRTESVLEMQLTLGLDEIPNDSTLLSQIIIAYEPVWAIGTGRTATPEMAQSVHQFIRDIVSKKLHFLAEETTVLYGGSVKPANIESLLAEKDIDGALVGGASLKPNDFNSLCCLGK